MNSYKATKEGTTMKKGALPVQSVDDLRAGRFQYVYDTGKLHLFI